MPKRYKTVRALLCLSGTFLDSSLYPHPPRFTNLRRVQRFGLAGVTDIGIHHWKSCRRCQQMQWPGCPRK
eukprot:763545-Hanusia_phi.AAC.5